MSGTLFLMNPDDPPERIGTVTDVVISDVSVPDEDIYIPSLTETVTVSMNVSACQASKFHCMVTGVTNNYIRMHGGKPIKWRAWKRYENRVDRK